MGGPLVSIITPTYNHERYIQECIESIISQSYPTWEMIIIDDGSSDRTPEIVERYLDRDDRIHYIYQRHKGIWSLGKLYNRALKLANGELLAILEGDDVWPYYKLEVQIKAFKDNSIIFSWGKYGLIDSHGRYISTREPPVKFGNIPRSQLLKYLLLVGNIIQPVTAMIRTDALIDIGGFKHPLNLPYVDYPTWLELAIYGNGYYFDRVLGYWRRHSSQATQRYYKEMTIKSGFYALYFFRRNRRLLKELNVDITEKDILIRRLPAQFLKLGYYYLDTEYSSEEINRMILTNLFSRAPLKVKLGALKKWVYSKVLNLKVEQV